MSHSLALSPMIYRSVVVNIYEIFYMYKQNKTYYSKKILKRITRKKERREKKHLYHNNIISNTTIDRHSRGRFNL